MICKMTDLRMKWRKRVLALLCSAACLAGLFSMPPAVRAKEQILSEETAAEADSTEIKPSELYARSAVLMDAESGRILFAKNGQDEAPMASTTKIMTCILALELGNLSDQVEVSETAASQPDVSLGMRTGQKFYLKDLLYSLMLESHNDSAVAIAEHIGGSVKGFSGLMNQKAKELKCSSTYFITPNGLDAEDENGIHHTTAGDLAQIMRYCIMSSDKKEEFLEITRTGSYTFSDCDGVGSYTCNNHNTFLKMMEGALTGKTGFTADAGYCYVGALKRDSRTFIVALLACGWPNNKGYKWSDTRKLMTYGIENYFYQEIGPDMEGISVTVENGYSGGFPGKGPEEITVTAEGGTRSVLLKKGEEVEVEWQVPKTVKAPLEKGEELGKVTYSVGGKILAEYPVLSGKTVGERTFYDCISYTAGRFFFH